MALSVNTPIVSRDLRGVKDFYSGKNKAGKIFLLKGVNNSAIVIKDDTVDDRQVNQASQVMSAIHAQSRTAMLGPGEKGQIRDFCQTELNLISAYKPLGIVYKTDQEAADIQTLMTQCDDFRTNFHKMAAQDVRDARGVLEDRLTGNKAEMKAMIATLKGPGGLEGLGEIITADLVIGNTDRFFPENWDQADQSSRTKVIGGQTFDFKVLINAGNVFVSLGNNGAASGLDYLDPQSLYKNMEHSLADIEQQDCPWPARILLDRKARSTFADGVIHDLELMFHPHKRRMSTKKKLGFNRRNRLLNGMVAGAGKIADALATNPTAAQQERITILRQVR